MNDRHESGFKERTRVADALAELREVLDPVDRTERVPVTGGVGRVLAEDVRARRPVPHYDRAAMDGYAVRAADTFGASDRSPKVLRAEESPGPERAVRVHTGSELPAGADAVVRVEDTERRGEDLDVTAAVAAGENVAPAGEDVAADETVLAAGHRLRHSDLGLCKAVGRSRVSVVERPTVGVLPTGEELVDADPDPEEVVETNGLTVASFVERWGGKPTYRDVVDDARHALRAAVERDLTKDLVVTTGGTSVGERDLLPEVVDDLGEVRVHGLGLKPGYPAGFGVVRETPVLLLPGYPVSCLVTAFVLGRPAVKRLGRLPLEPHPGTDAELSAKIASEVGVRTYARVALDGSRETDAAADGADLDVETADDGPGERGAALPTADPVHTAGAGVMSSVAAADGWVVVPESREGVPAGERVAVQHWEFQP
jgi:molybdopterin molybdotransferase